MKPSYEELEQKLAVSQREFRAADATIENMQMQLEKVTAENAGLKNALEWLYETVSSESVSIPDEKYSSVTNAAQVLSETPATDAFLAEVRASGVEMFSRSLRGEAEITKACTFKPVQQFDDFVARAEEFAAQLRQGVAK